MRLWYCFRNRGHRVHENQSGSLRSSSSSSPGNRKEMLICQTSVQTNISVQQVLCVDSGIGVYQPQTACVSTINTRHAPCLGETGFQAHCCCCCCRGLPCSEPSALRVFVIKTSNRCVALTHLTQPVPPLSCDGIPALWYNPGCTHTRAPIHVFVCVCVSTPPQCWQHRSSTEVCWRAPTWQRGLFFIHRQGKYVFTSLR